MLIMGQAAINFLVVGIDDKAITHIANEINVTTNDKYASIKTHTQQLIIGENTNWPTLKPNGIFVVYTDKFITDINCCLEWRNIINQLYGDIPCMLLVEPSIDIYSNISDKFHTTIHHYNSQQSEFVKYLMIHELITVQKIDL